MLSGIKFGDMASHRSRRRDTGTGKDSEVKTQFRPMRHEVALTMGRESSLSCPLDLVELQSLLATIDAPGYTT